MKMADAKQKRNEQLKRWIGSETDLEPPVVKRKKTKVKFDDGAVFLAACSSGDTEEVLRLLERGADINYANVDGLTALHQVGAEPFPLARGGVGWGGAAAWSSSAAAGPGLGQAGKGGMGGEAGWPSAPPGGGGGGRGRRRLLSPPPGRGGAGSAGREAPAVAAGGGRGGAARAPRAGWAGGSERLRPFPAGRVWEGGGWASPSAGRRRCR